MQCRIKVGAIDAAALGPFVKEAHRIHLECYKILVKFQFRSTK